MHVVTDKDILLFCNYVALYLLFIVCESTIHLYLSAIIASAFHMFQRITNYMIPRSSVFCRQVVYEVN